VQAGAWRFLPDGNTARKTPAWTGLALDARAGVVDASADPTAGPCRVFTNVPRREELALVSQRLAAGEIPRSRHGSPSTIEE